MTPAHEEAQRRRHRPRGYPNARPRSWREEFGLPPRVTPDEWKQARARRGYGLTLRLRTAFERGLRRRVQAILQSQAPAIAAEARRSDPLGAIGVRLAQDLGLLERDLRASYVAAGTQLGERRATSFGRRFLPEPVVDFARRHALDRAVRVTDGTRELARRSIERSLLEGVGVQEVADRLERDTRVLARPRSLVIARTEIGIAAGFGDFEGARQSGLSLRKVWLTAADGGERHPSEPGLEGQVRELDEAFDVRGHPGAHPLALELPASEVVNCRCDLGYERS